MSTTMTSRELDRIFSSWLEPERFDSADASLNGLQIDNSGIPISKVAFAVDACMETFEKAAACGAGLLFVHHGLFWGKPLALRGVLRERIAFLLSHDIALYACHLPLDQHPELGNNASLSALLEMQDIQPFGLYHGKKIGYKGVLPRALSCNEIVEQISFKQRPPALVLNGGPTLNKTCAIVSGGAPMEALQAIQEGLDVYITGEAAHEIYHPVFEAGINFIAAGHYSSEVWGVRKVMEKLAKEISIDTEFIDAPSGL